MSAFEPFTGTVANDSNGYLTIAPAVWSSEILPSPGDRVLVGPTTDQGDLEIDAMRTTLVALERLDDAARLRAMTWLARKFGMEFDLSQALGGSS